MNPFDLLRIVAETCNGLNVRYLTVGSLATIAFGRPRFTNDIDVVIDLRPEHVEPFCRAFSGSEYYLSKAAVGEAIRKRTQFNIVHTTAGLKVDCFLPSDSEFDQSQLGRGVRKQVTEDFAAVFGSPEDVIVKKMEYYQIGESEKHLRDIEGVLEISGDLVDRDYIQKWAEQKGLGQIWSLILARLSKS
jgi:hypothetical protein